jgi:hypothetical protein
LDDLQIRVIKAALLGNTLKIRFTTKLYDPLSRWLVSKVDTVNCKLVLGSKKKPVVIDLYEAAAKVIGVRNDGWDVDISKFADSKCSGKGKRNVFSGCKQMPLYCRILEDCRKLRKRTLKVYMYAILTWLLACPSQEKIDLRFFEMVEDSANIHMWNLTKLTVDLLVKGILDVQGQDNDARKASRKFPTLVGNPLLLFVSNLQTSI